MSAMSVSRRMTPPARVLKGLPSLPFIVPKPMCCSSVSGGTRWPFARRAEHLLEVQTLALVRQVQQLVRMVILHALHDGGQVRRGVQRRAVALDEDARRQLLAVALLGHGHDERALALDKHASAFSFSSIGDVGLRVAFAFPDVEADVQIVIVLTQIGHGDLHDVAPQGIVAGTALLHGKRDLVSAGGEGLVLPSSGRWPWGRSPRARRS